MKDSPPPPRTSDAHGRRRLLLARLEADLAYFQARLEMLGEPRTSNQEAQRRTFEILQRSLGDMVLRARSRMAHNGR